MTEGLDFEKKAIGKHGHFSPKSKGARCDLNNKGDFLKMHDKSPNVNYNCQKQVTLTPRQVHLEGRGIKSKLQKNLKALKKLGTGF